jgi:hypothetical protein
MGMEVEVEERAAVHPEPLHVSSLSMAVEE